MRLQSRSAKNSTYICRRVTRSGSGPNGGTNGSLQKNIEWMWLKMRYVGTCDDALPQREGYNLHEVAVGGCYPGWGEWTSQIDQKTPLSRVGHRHSPSAELPFSGWGRPRAKCTGQDSERVPKMSMGTYVSLTMGATHADGFGLITLTERCPAWIDSGGRARSPLFS